MSEPVITTKTVLFLCTGNYYRSRFAEILFNVLTGHAETLPEDTVPDAVRATHAQLNSEWIADSAGLRAHNFHHCNIGPLSPDAYRALFERKIDMSPHLRKPRQVTEAELAGAGLVIALKETEHRPMMRELHPAWEDRIEYWEVNDVPPSANYDPMAHVDEHVRALVERLAGITDS